MKKALFAVILSLVSVGAYANSFSALSGNHYGSDEHGGIFEFDGKNKLTYSLGVGACRASGVLVPMERTKQTFVLRVKKGDMAGFACPNKFNGLKVAIIQINPKTKKATNIKITNSNKDVNGIYEVME